MKRLWPGRTAIGQQLRIGGTGERVPAGTRPTPAVVEIAGTVGDVTIGYANDDASRTTIYLPVDEAQPGTALLVRVRGSADLAEAASTLLGVSMLGHEGQLVEIEAIAVLE